MPLRLGRTARETLQEFIDIDVTAGDLVRILNENQVYRDLFFRFVAKKTAKLSRGPSKEEAKDGKKPESSPTHRLINLLGMIGSRNLMLALRMHRLTEGSFPVNPEGEVDLKASDYLKRSSEVEELFVRNKLEYSETAFAAGVYFDLSYKLHEKDEANKKLEDYFKRNWQRALRTGLLAYFLAEKVSGILPKSALAAGMLSQAGKPHMAVWFRDKNYAESEVNLDTNLELPPLGRMLLERSQFGVAHEDIGAHTLRYFDVFKNLIPIVQNYREPYNFKGADSKAHSLCVLLWLADSMARSWKIPADEKDPAFNQWGYPSLAALKLKRSTLIEVMKRAMTLK